MLDMAIWKLDGTGERVVSCGGVISEVTDDLLSPPRDEPAENHLSRDSALRGCRFAVG